MDHRHVRRSALSTEVIFFVNFMKHFPMLWYIFFTMAHKTVNGAIAGLVAQQKKSTDVLFAWAKDLAQWKEEILTAVDQEKYVLIDPPETVEKSSQKLVLAKKKVA